MPKLFESQQKLELALYSDDEISLFFNPLAVAVMDAILAIA